MCEPSHVMVEIEPWVLEDFAPEMDTKGDSSKDSERYTYNVATNTSSGSSTKIAIRRKKKQKDKKEKDRKAKIHKDSQVEKTVPCSHCKRTFSGKSYLKKHMDSVLGKYTCKYCDKNCTNKKALAVHLLKEHDPEKPYNCEFCERSFTSRERVKMHAKTHNHKRPYECSVCAKRFTNKPGYRTHLKSHGGKHFECAMCGKRYPLKNQLRWHILGHNGEIFTCDICEKSFPRKSSLSLHFKIHMRRKPFPCEWDGCNKGFMTRGKLEKHALTHQPGHLRHVCHICFHTFPSKYHLDLHLGTHEKEGLDIEYDQTKMLSKFEENHVRETVGDKSDNEEGSNMVKVFIVEERHKCKECKQVFLNTELFAEHGKVHRTETEHHCKVCSKTFKQSYYLKIHMRTHTGEKPYECNICDKKFVTSSKLSRHIKMHTGEKVHQCTTCYKFFSRPSYLRSHMKTHLKEISKATLKSAYVEQNE